MPNKNFTQFTESTDYTINDFLVGYASAGGTGAERRLKYTALGTTANTANKLVLRDGTGSFSAGTATLNYLSVNAGDATNEGGEIQLKGAGTYGSIQIDNFQGNARIHTLASGKVFQILGGNLSVEGTGNNYLAGKTGLGVNIPNLKLEVVSGSAGRSVGIDTREIKFRGDSVAHFSIYGAETGEDFLSIRNTSSTPAPGNTGTTLLAVKAGGDVGIGTTTPGARLHVVGSGVENSSPELQVSGSNGWTQLHVSSSAGGWNPLVVAGDKTFIFSNGTLGTGNLVIAPWTDSGYGIRITSAGTVGIGIQQPSYTLHVNGSVYGNHRGIAYGSAGTSYSAAFQIREADLNGSNSLTDSYRPRLAFHWGGVVASSISLRSDGGFSFDDNPGTGKSNIFVSEVYADGWLRSGTSAGWYSQAHGGGWYMQDSTWIRAYNSKNVWVGPGLIGNDAGLTIGYGGTGPNVSGGAIISGSVGIGTASPGVKLDVNGVIRSNNEIIGSALGGWGQARYINGRYGIIHRNDGSDYYILKTALDDQYGTWDSSRPFTINNTSGNVSMGENVSVGKNLTVSGNITVNSGNNTNGGIIFSDDGYITDQQNGYATFRFSGGIAITSGINSTTNTILLKSNGDMVCAGNVVCGGSVTASNLSDITGMVAYFANSNTGPAGWVECNGASIPTGAGYEAYQKLRTYLINGGNVYGVDGSQNPRVPDLRGRFMRTASGGTWRDQHYINITTTANSNVAVLNDISFLGSWNETLKNSKNTAWYNNITIGSTIMASGAIGTGALAGAAVTAVDVTNRRITFNRTAGSTVTGDAWLERSVGTFQNHSFENHSPEVYVTASGSVSVGVTINWTQNSNMRADGSTSYCKRIDTPGVSVTVGNPSVSTYNKGSAIETRPDNISFRAYIKI